MFLIIKINTLSKYLKLVYLFLSNIHKPKYGCSTAFYSTKYYSFNYYSIYELEAPIISYTILF